MNKKQTISVNDDLMIEIHHNPHLNYKPFQFRVYGYNSYSEHRLDVKDMVNLAETIADFAFDNSDALGYNDSFTGLARLWHHRRNEVLEILDQKDDATNSNR
jgi:hypothetical protein